jgi:SPP1 gp7 family putative phage head morphogenesis protein
VPLALQTVDDLIAEEEEPEPPPMPPQFPPAADDEEPEEPEEEDEEGVEEEDEEERAANIKRAKLWRAYIRQVHRPNEKRMRKAVSGWIRGRRADTLRALAEMDGRSRDITDDTVAAWLAGQQERWHDLLAEQTKGATTGTIEAVLDQVAGQIGELQYVSMESPAILALIEEQGARKIVTVKSTQKAVRRALLEGLSQSENLTQLQDRVRQVFKVVNSRALTIARTETGMAAQDAKQEVFRAEGITKHTWITAGDGNERDTHLMNDGETRTIGEPFPNRQEYPLHDIGVPGEVINCRCDVVAEV